MVCLHRKYDFAFVDVPVVGDGNCQFRALSRALFGDEERHKEVRISVVGNLRAHPLPLEWHHATMAGGTSSPSESWAQYCDRMLMNGEWGDQTTLFAAARTYNVAFVVHNVLSDTQFLQTDEQSGSMDTHTRLIYLAYTQDEHYNLRGYILTQPTPKRHRSDENEGPKVYPCKQRCL